MPEYTYHCSGCGNAETLVEARGAARTNTCPCGKERKRVLTSTMGMQSKFNEATRPLPEGRVNRDGLVIDRYESGQTYQHVHDENGQPIRFKSGTQAGQLAELKAAAEAQVARNNPDRKEPITFDVTAH